MDFLKRFFGRSTDTKYKYRGAKLPKEPLTPREIEEIHRKLHPDTHIYNAALPKPVFDPRDWSVPYTKSLEEKLPVIGLLYQAQSESFLFSRLPVEVRMQIWRLAMGNHKVHLTVHHGRLRQSIFESENYQWLPQRALLEIPLVCRAAYVYRPSSRKEKN